MELYFSGKPESDEEEPDDYILLKNKLRRVDITLENKLIADYETEFGSISDEF